MNDGYEVWLRDIATAPFRPQDMCGWSKVGVFDSKMEAEAFLEAIHDSGVVIDTRAPDKEKVRASRSESVRRGVDAYIGHKKKHIEVRSVEE